MSERPMFRRFGGKHRIAEAIVGMFPWHDVYVEPYGGAASVLMAKARCSTEVLNDLDRDVVNVYRCLRDRGAELQRLLELTPFSRAEYEAAYKPARTAVERARRFIFRSMAGIGADSCRRRNGLRTSRDSDKYAPARGWATWAECVPFFTARLEGVIIECRPALRVLREQDGPRTLHYVDPPYPGETRRGSNGYKHDLRGRKGHEELAAVLNGLRGMVVLSGYVCPLYDRLFTPAEGWRCERVRGARDQHNRVREEALWLRNVPEVCPELFGREAE